MRINLPVTGQERGVRADISLVSRTDNKGVITFANDAFLDISGFSRQELIGKNHNIVRHPDMPPAVFEAMWATLKAGLPWRGIIKNRCKNGDHYWVDAKVIPVKNNGQITGYMSVRSCPSRDDVAAAEAIYKAAICSPAAMRSKESAWKRHFSVRNGVAFGMMFFILLMIAGGILGISGLHSSTLALRALYHQDLQPVQAIGRINFLMADNRAQMALALHHDPRAHRAESFPHDLNAHLSIVERNKS